MGTAKSDDYAFTPRDLELLVNALGCTKLPFEIKYDELSRRLGYKNASSAKAAENALRKKLDKVEGGAAVVRSLTVMPAPVRRSAATVAEAGGSKKGKHVVAKPSDLEQESESESEE